MSLHLFTAFPMCHNQWWMQYTFFSEWTLAAANMQQTAAQQHRLSLETLAATEQRSGQPKDTSIGHKIQLLKASQLTQMCWNLQPNNLKDGTDILCGTKEQKSAVHKYLFCSQELVTFLLQNGKLFLQPFEMRDEL